MTHRFSDPLSGSDMDSVYGLLAGVPIGLQDIGHICISLAMGQKSVLSPVPVKLYREVAKVLDFAVDELSAIHFY